MTALYNGIFGVVEVITDGSCLSKIEHYAFYETGKFNEAGIKHLVCTDVLRLSYYQSYKELSVVICAIYFDMLKLGLCDNCADKVEKDYSFLMTHEWIFVIPGKANNVQFDGCELNLDSVCAWYADSI
jgi:ATP adenylyltransferase/5',5'''-P-1,P-4-tetraphosphate phosphorylase II